MPFTSFSDRMRTQNDQSPVNKIYFLFHNCVFKYKVMCLIINKKILLEIVKIVALGNTFSLPIHLSYYKKKLSLFFLKNFVSNINFCSHLPIKL